MSMKQVIVAVVALTVGATLTLHAQRAQWLPGERTPSGDFRAVVNGLEVYLPIQGKVVKGMPYSAEVVNESVQTLGDGNRIVHRSSGKVYRDSEGRMRREEDRGNSVNITISDPVANKSYTLDAANRTARETGGLRYFNGAKPAAARGGTIGAGRGGRGVGRGAGRGGSEGPVEEQLASRNIEGVVASGVRRTTTIPQGAIGNEQPIKIVSEEWTSADLQVLVLTDMNDPRTGRTTYKLLNINRANPDPALFKVPSDYTLQVTGRGRGGRGK